MKGVDAGQYALLALWVHASPCPQLCTIILLCRLVNRSGLRLSYWVDTPGGASQSESYSLPSWEESSLQVEPVEKTVILPDTQLQVGPAQAPDRIPSPEIRCFPACFQARLHERQILVTNSPIEVMVAEYTAHCA